jgi:uncharacterized membrane protein
MDSNAPIEQRWVRQLGRLETLMDVVYGLIIWRLFMLLPRPMEDETRTVLQLFADDPRDALSVAIGIIIVIIYWMQSNLLFGHLERTDTRHTTLSIIQIFCLLLFLYSIVLGTKYEAASDLRLFESIAALLVGVPSYLAWRHAKRNAELVSPSLSKEDADAMSVQILAEPITAALTIPFAIFTPLLWEVVWFSYPLISRILRKRQDKL